MAAAASATVMPAVRAPPQPPRRFEVKANDAPDALALDDDDDDVDEEVSAVADDSGGGGDGVD